MCCVWYLINDLIYVIKVIIMPQNLNLKNHDIDLVFAYEPTPSHSLLANQSQNKSRPRWCDLTTLQIPQPADLIFIRY
jgi:hypothetical protein